MILKRLRTRFGIPVALMAVLALAVPAGASALGLGETEEFFAPTEPTAPFAVTKGSDGNVWYTNEGSTKVGKVTPAGAVTEYSPGLASAAYGIAKGPDGDIWVTEPTAKKVGHFDPSEPETSLTECSVTNMPAVSFIATGPDGNLWMSLGAAGIGRVTPGCVVTEFPTTGTVCSVTAGPDGNVWFTTCTAPRGVGKITPSGTITKYEVTGSLGIQSNSIALGSDERLWVSTSKGTTERVAAVTTTGTVSYYPTLANVIYTSFTPGADGNVWARNNASVNEKQVVTVEATENLGGTFKLVYKGEETAAISFEASAESVKNKLGALPAIGGSANVEVVEVITSNKSTYTIEFRGKLARTNIEQLTCNASGLTGTAASCGVTTQSPGAPVKLVRIPPAGTPIEEFPLKASAVFTNNSAKANGVAAGPGASLWYASAGDTTPEPDVPKAIGKFGLGINEYALTLTKEGTGDGTVVSNPAGIECSPTCSAEFKESTQVTLTASPDSESLFVSWKGCEAGGALGRTCKVTMDKAKTVVAKFIQAYDVSVTRKGTGLGKVGSSPGGVLCLSNCSSTSAAFKELTNVTLTATPSKNFTFTGWSGDCSGTGTCVLSSLEADKAVEAEFTAVPQFNLTVTKSGGGNGTVKAKQAGINCGATCTSQAAAYYQGTEVELSVTPGKGSTFGGWSKSAGTCTGTTNPCKVTVSAAKEVQAEFK